MPGERGAGSRERWQGRGRPRQVGILGEEPPYEGAGRGEPAGPLGLVPQTGRPTNVGGALLEASPPRILNLLSEAERSWPHVAACLGEDRLVVIKSLEDGGSDQIRKWLLLAG